MQFSSYAAFRTAVLTLIDGDDVSQSDLSVPTLDLMIAAGEVRVYRELRSSAQDVALSITSTANVATLPTDFLELKSIIVANGAPPTYVPYEIYQTLAQSGAMSSPLRYSFEGDTLVFYPSYSGTVSGRYYKKYADIASSLNAVFTRHPDVFLYAALAESAPFLGDDERLPIWEGKYQALVREANEQERRRVTRGSKLVTRVG